MDINVDKSKLSCCRVLREAKAEQSVDCDITLPDYCSDIKSVLCCSVEPGVTGVDITGNRVTAMGNAVIRLVYVGENDKIACFEQNYPLSKYVEMSSLPQEAAVLVCAKTSYVNCRAVSPRRVDVHGCITVIFTAVCCEESQIVTSASGNSLQLKQEPFKSCCAVGCASKLFEMSDTAEIREQGAKIKSVMHAAATPTVTETKCVSNKILIKGDLLVTMALCGDEGQIIRQEHSLPISRIVELEGLQDNSICDVRVDTSALDVKLLADDSGNMSKLDIAAVIKITVYAYKELACAFVLDAYSTAGKVDLTQNTVLQESLAANLNENFLLSSSLDFSASPAASVLDFWCNDLTCVSGCNDKALEISGAVTLCVLFEDSEGKPCLTKHRLDYRHTKDFADFDGQLCYEPMVKITGAAVSGSGEQLNARIQFNAQGCVFAQKKVLAVTDMLVDETAPKAEQAPAITVYFADKGEKLWDIAKKFNTAVSAISRRNNLNADEPGENTMLIIPRA